MTETTGDIAEQFAHDGQPEPDPTVGDEIPETPVPAWVTPKEITSQAGYATGMRVVPSGFGSLDSLMLGGFLASCLYIVASRTGGAKTAFVDNMARLMALAGTVVLLLTLEDPIRVAFWRMHAAAANVPLTTLLHGFAGQHGPAIKALHSAYRLLSDIPLRLSDVRAIDEIEPLIAAHASDGGKIVILDQVSKISTPHLVTASQYERVTEISERLRLAAVTYEMPIIIVSQVNREASKRPGDLDLHDLRDSGMLEQDAAGVLLINKAHEPAKSSGQTQPFCKMLPVKLAKQRFGPAGKKIELIWHPRTGRIDDPTLASGVEAQG